MSNNQKQANSKVEEPKSQLKTQPKVESNVKQPEAKALQKQQTQEKNKGQEKKFDTKKLGLVFYEVAKQQNSVFSEQQKFPIRFSTVGVFLGVSAATLLNICHMVIKPSEKHRKWFLISGIANIVGSVFVGAYGLHNVGELYKAVPEIEWARIQVEKENYEKLGFLEQRQFLGKKIQEDKKKQQEKAQKQKQQQNQLTNEKIDLVK